MLETVLLVCERTRAQMLREQEELCALYGVAKDYEEVVCACARALQLVDDDRDAYVYYHVGEDLNLGWDFSDPTQTRELRRWLDSVAFVFQSRPTPFSGAALARTCKDLAESLRPDKELEESLLWLRNLSDTIREEELRDCADLP